MVSKEMFVPIGTDLENIHSQRCNGGVMVCEEMSADRPDRDGS